MALDETHSSAVLSLFAFFLCQVALRVGESDAKDESAPAQTSPQKAGFGSDRPSACWRSVLVVVFAQQMSTNFHPAVVRPRYREGDAGIIDAGLEDSFSSL